MQRNPKDGDAQAREPDRELLAYAAGLFDGEGYVTIARTLTGGPTPRYSLVAGITMTDPQSIQYLTGHFGSHLSRYERTRVGWSAFYVWNLRGHQALPFLEAIRPYLLVKGQQAAVGIRFCKGYYTPKDLRPNTPVTVERVAFAEECKRELGRLNAPGELSPSLSRKRRVAKGQLALPAPGGRPRQNSR